MSCRISPAIHGILLLLASACGATHGDVEHPQLGAKNTPEHCARASGQQGTCMACASRPGCGYCPAPLQDAPLCQPGVESDDAPSTCGERLVLSTPGCDAPPPPARGVDEE